MKIGGREIKGPNFEIIVIPRGNGEENIIMKAMAVVSADAFEKMCPAPVPPAIVKAGGAKEFNFNDKNYKEAQNRHGALRMAWTIVESLRLGTPDLEWDSVKFDDPSTFEKWQDDLKNAGFSNIEIQRVMQGVFNANCLNETMIEQARTTFLRGMAVTSEK